MIPPRSQGGGNILINSSSNIYPMDCDPPSLISLQQQLTPSSGSTSVSLNVINPRYLQQHMHNNRSSRYNAPLVTKSTFAPASLPIDLIPGGAGSSSGMGSSTNSIMVIPDHLNSSSLIISSSGGSSYHHPVSSYAPYTINTNDVQLTHQNKAASSSSGVGRSGNTTNSNNSNNNTTGDESMVGVCVQQSPVVIH